MTAVVAQVQPPPPPRGGTAGIAFLDDDHVLAMARGLLTATTDTDWSRVAQFCAPELPEAAVLRAIRRGLGPADDVTVVESARDATVLMLRRGSVDRQLIESAPRLRLIQRLGAGTDRIDLATAHRYGIEVSCLPRRSLAFTAEHTIALVLALSKRLLPADRAVRGGSTVAGAAGSVAYNWASVHDIRGLTERTLGIVGLGEVGILVARLACAFGMAVVYANPTRAPAAREAAIGARHLPLPQLLAEADVVSVHVPGAAQREPIIGRAEIAAMRPGALLVNTSRGWLVDDDALYEALVEGRLGGAGLDVHWAEPRPPGDRYHDLDNVVLTPHIAGGSRLGVLDEVSEMFDNIRAVLRCGVPPHGRVTEGPC